MIEKEEYIKDYANRRGVPIIREESHKMLQEIVNKLQPKNILEIGTAVGYSGMLMLDIAKNAKLTTIELDYNKVLEAQENFAQAGMQERVNIIHGDCMEQVSLMVAEGKHDKHFDFVFLDGPKAQYVKILESLLMLTKSGGTILADNVLFRGFVRGDKTEMPKRFKTLVKRLENFLDTVETHPDIQSYKLYELEDGMLEFKVK